MSVEVIDVWLIFVLINAASPRNDQLLPFGDRTAESYCVFRVRRSISVSFHRAIRTRAANNNIKFEETGSERNLCKHVTDCRVTRGAKSNRRWKRDKFRLSSACATRHTATRLSRRACSALDLEFKSTFQLIKTQTTPPLFLRARDSTRFPNFARPSLFTCYRQSEKDERTSISSRAISHVFFSL